MNQKTKGALLLISSSFFFALMSVFVTLAGDVPFYQKALFRNLVAVLVAGIALVKTNASLRVPKGVRLPMAMRAVFGTAGVFCNYYGISHLALANANSLNKLAPFFAVLFGGVFLKEHVSRAQLGCVLLALAGSMFLVIPSIETVGFASFVALLGGVVGGATHVSLRAVQRDKSVSGSAVVFIFCAFSTLVTAVPCLIQWEPMTSRQVLIMLLAGCSCAAAQYCLTWSYRCASPKDISIYDSTQIIFSAIMGFIFFEQMPAGTSFIAYALIILASAILFIHNKRPDTA